MTRTWNGRVKAARVLLLLVTSGVAAPAAGQTQTEQRVWTAVSVQGGVGAGSPWRWASDSFVMARDGARTLDFLAERVLVTRDLTRRSGVGIGYTFGAWFPDTGSLREHRFVQQHTWSGGVSPRVSLRSRLEERFVTGQDAVLLRASQQVRVAWPLSARGRLQAVASEEMFVLANSTTRGPRGVESNQIFVGVARRLTARSGTEIGYVNVYSWSGSGRRQRSHVMSATLVVSM
ncbi:MAG TPA: DUF2490 domain-containing protein [Vicinamibacterales bacterium]|jgi:hypothetical protein|nr:DUF2490 domain-containing protein [Vicinamibacterales bacterium]